MIVLTLRTDNPDAELGIFEDTDEIVYETWPAHRQLAETIHQKLADMLEAQGKTLHDLSGIVCFQGPGSFTGLRIGLSVANALAAGLNVPIVATQGDEWISVGLTRIVSGENDVQALPFYGADAHITPQKK